MLVFSRNPSLRVNSNRRKRRGIAMTALLLLRKKSLLVMSLNELAPEFEVFERSHSWTPRGQQAAKHKNHETREIRHVSQPRTDDYQIVPTTSTTPDPTRNWMPSACSSRAPCWQEVPSHHGLSHLPHRGVLSSEFSLCLRQALRCLYQGGFESGHFHSQDLVVAMSD